MGLPDDKSKLFKNYQRRYCTVPKIFGFDKWFERRFHDLCCKHDRRYVRRQWLKWYVDLIFVVHMIRRGVRYIPLAMGSWVMFWTVGLWYWYTE